MDIDAIVANIGARLKELRAEKGLTQERLAAASGVSRRAIANYEAAAKIPPTDKLLRLAFALGLTADEFLEIKPIKSSKTDISLTTLKKARQIDLLPSRPRKQVYSLVRELSDQYNLGKE